MFFKVSKLVGLMLYSYFSARAGHLEGGPFPAPALGLPL